MHIINLKEWLKTKPEDRKEFLKSCKVDKEDIMQQWEEAEKIATMYFLSF